MNNDKGGWGWLDWLQDQKGGWGWLEWLVQMLSP